MKVHHSSKTNEWTTPDDFFEGLDKRFNFTLDPCSTKSNTKCDAYYTKEDDGLSKVWAGHTVFVNPPYGNEIGEWVKKSYEESVKKNRIQVVMLVPARTDTKYWYNYIYGEAREVHFIRGRLSFGGKGKRAPFPSAVIYFDGRKENLTLMKTKDSRANIIYDI